MKCAADPTKSEPELTPATFERLDALGDRVRAGIAGSIERAATDARVEAVGSLFQVWSGGSVAAFATGVGAVPGLFIGLLLEGFYVAPRGMGAIPAIATGSDVDELAAAVGRVLATLEQAPQMARA